MSGAPAMVTKVAAGLQHPMEDVEGICDDLCQQGQFLVAHEVVEWPDGTVTVQYGFGHALYHAVVYGRLGLAQRVRLHRLLGERLERGYGERAHEIASTLALHFTRGRDEGRAVQYRQQAAEHAAQRVCRGTDALSAGFGPPREAARDRPAPGTGAADLLQVRAPHWQFVACAECDGHLCRLRCPSSLARVDGNSDNMSLMATMCYMLRRQRMPYSIIG
jgi:hypothetical protein